MNYYGNTNQNGFYNNSVEMSKINNNVTEEINLGLIHLILIIAIAALCYCISTGTCLIEKDFKLTFNIYYLGFQIVRKVSIFIFFVSFALTIISLAIFGLGGTMFILTGGREQA